MKVKKILIRLVVFGFTFLLLLLVADVYVSWSVKEKHTSDVESVSVAPVGIVLGTSKYVRNGYINPYYANRIYAALELYQRKKVRYFILSGDNGRRTYNEPHEMKRDLISAGVPGSRIFLDFAGFRTYDSMYRLKHVFACDTVIIVSQKFHNQRALFIADKLGIEAMALNAEDVEIRRGGFVRVREVLARVKMLSDVVWRIPPRLTGEKIPLPHAG